MPPATPRGRRGRRDGAGDDERAIAQRARRLVAALTEPEATDIEELVQLISDESGTGNDAGRRWVAAVRRVQRDGRLPEDEADAIVDDVVHAMLRKRTASDAESRRLSGLLKPLHEEHHANWEAYRAERKAAGKDPNGPRDPESEPVYPEGMKDLMDEYAARYGELYREVLESLGESAMAASHRADSKAHLWRMIRGSQALAHRGDTTDGFRLSFTPPENVPLPPPLGPTIDPDAPEFEKELEGRGLQLLDAMSEKPMMMSIPVVLAFATIESFENTDGMGNIWIRAVQIVRGGGHIDRDLSWLLLDRITDWMIPGELEDQYQMELRDQIWEAEAEFGEEFDEADPAAVARAPEQLQVLYRAMRRRETMLKVRILRAAGEVEMVEAMEERPDEYRATIVRMAELWDEDVPE